MNGNQTNRAAERLVQRIQRYTNISVLFSQIGEQGGRGAEVQRSGGAEEMVWGTTPAPEISFGGQGGFAAQQPIQRQVVPSAPVASPPPLAPVPAPSGPPPAPAQPPIQRQDTPAASPVPQRPLADNPNIPWSRLQAIRQLHRQETAETSAAPTPLAESPSVPTAAPTPEPDDTPMPWVLQRQAKEEARRKVETQGPRRVLRRSSLVEVNGPKGAGEQGGRGAEVQRSGGEEVQRGVDPEITSAMGQELGAPALTGGEVSRAESGEKAGGAEVQRSGAESPPLPNPKSQIENPVPSRPPLEQAWPVQRASEPATAASAAVSEPSYDPPAGTPPPREPSPEAVQAQEVMRHIAPEKASSSSVDFVMPTRPRPAPPVQRETAVPSSSSSPSPASEPQMVNTEIGQLPSDLWGLLGDTPPVQREEAAEYSHAVVDATGGGEAQGSGGAGEMETSVQRVEEAEGQRSGEAEEMGAAVQREELPAADSAPSAPFMERTPSLPTSAEEQRNGGAEGMGAPVQRQDGPEVTAPTRAEEQGSGGAGEVGAAVQRQEMPATPPPPSAPFTGHVSSPSASAAGDLAEAEEAVAPVQRQESPEVTAPIIQAGEQGGRGAEEMGAAVQREEVPTAEIASAPFTGRTSSPSASAAGDLGAAEVQRSGGAEEMVAPVQRHEGAEEQGSRGAGEMGAAVQREEVSAAELAPSAPFAERTSSPSTSAAGEAEAQRSGGAEEMVAPVQRQESPEVTTPPIQAGGQGSVEEMGAPVQRQETAEAVPTPETASTETTQFVQRASDLDEPTGDEGLGTGGSDDTPPPPPPPPAPPDMPPSLPSDSSNTAEPSPAPAPSPETATPPSGDAMVDTTGGMETPIAAGPAESAPSSGVWLTAEATPTSQPVLVRPQGEASEAMLHGDSEGVTAVIAQSAPPTAQMDVLRLFRDETQAAEQLPEAAPFLLQPQQAQEPPAISYADSAEATQFMAEAATAEQSNALALYASESEAGSEGGQLVPVILQLEGEASLHVGYANGGRLADFLPQMATQERDGIQLFATEAQADRNEVTDAETLVVQVKGAAEKYLLFASASALAGLLAQAESLNRGATIMAYADEGTAAADTSNVVQILLKQDEEETVVIGFADRQEVDVFLVQAAEWQADTTLDEIARHVYQHLQHQLVVERERRAF